MKILTACTVLLISGTALSQIQVPYDFQSGEPARASEVNANFDTLEGAVNQNTALISGNIEDTEDNASLINGNARSIAANSANISSNLRAIENNASSIASLSAIGGITVYSQGVPIGRFLAFSEDVVNVWFLLSDQSFVFSVNVSSRDLQHAGPRNIYFPEPNCSGQALVRNVTSNPVRATFLSSGLVFPLNVPDAANAPLYYTKRGSQPSDRPYQSVLSSLNVCENEQATLSFHEAFSNDEQVTGVPNTPLTGPLLFGAP